MPRSPKSSVIVNFDSPVSSASVSAKDKKDVRIWRSFDFVSEDAAEVLLYEELPALLKHLGNDMFLECFKSLFCTANHKLDPESGKFVHNYVSKLTMRCNEIELALIKSFFEAREMKPIIKIVEFKKKASE